ncbi:cytochrome P450 [Micromonospora sp. WMMD998]|uniref:cytochrome P450 n=1 Tax=Micromonospora sp. WMMD998 TaxID=3016092 RepID=UPI00249C017E|nr:cytochrome P450 [Micromonospora sp. WMMD998]WFE41022.1 cytochrome P450 [Micromonospora sp. WMMD998]
MSAPGPGAAAAPAAVTGLVFRPLATLRSLARYGDAVELPLYPGHRLFVLSGPRHAEHVLARHQDNYLKAFTYRSMRAVLGTGLLSGEGETWRRHRRLLQPVFTRRNVAGFTPQIVEATRRMLDSWDRHPDGTRIEVSGEVSALALDIVGRVLFGADMTGRTGQIARALTLLLPAVAIGTFLPFLWGPRSTRAIRAASERFGGPLAAIDRPVRQLIAERRATPTVDGPPDLLDRLLTARDEEDRTRLTDAEIRDEVTTFMLAGHETTATTLSWCLALLSAHPAVRDRLEQEVDAVLAGREPQAADVEKLRWTTAVVNEAWRLYPPVWTIEREAVRSDVIEGIPIPVGSTVAVPAYLVHRNPAVWPDPERYDPTRFLSDADRDRYAHIPFGGGRRACIGAGFAQLEAVLVLAMMTQRYRLELTAGLPRPLASATLRPGRRLPMRLTCRP